MKELQEVQEKLNLSRPEYNFNWNYFPIREVIPGSAFYAISARIEFDKSITYISCDEKCTPNSIRIISIR